MDLIFLASTRPDLEWFRSYYGTIFPEGSIKASAAFVAAVDKLVANPYIGRPMVREGFRRLLIAKTPFLIIYQVSATRIDVVRIWDQRADPTKLGFQEEAAVLA